MIVVRNGDVQQAVRRCEVGTYVGIAAPDAPAAAGLFEQLRQSLGWVSMKLTREQGNERHRNRETGVVETWIYARVTAGNAKQAGRMREATPAAGARDREVRHVAVA